MRISRTLVPTLAVVAIATAGCGGSKQDKGVAKKPSPTTSSAQAVADVSWQPTVVVGSPAKAGACRLVNSRIGGKALQLPDKRCTPGGAATDVKQTLVASTTCKPAYVSSRVPDRRAMTAASEKVFAAYGIPASARSNYTVQFLVPSSLGGAFSYQNLWPVPKTGATPSVKSGIDDWAKRVVCRGTTGLDYARHLVSADWPSALKYIG